MAARRQGSSFVDRHELWTGEQRRAAAAMEQAIRRHNLEVIIFCFVDQQGT